MQSSKKNLYVYEITLVRLWNFFDGGLTKLAIKLKNKEFLKLKLSINKIEGTPILKLATVKRLKVKKIFRKIKTRQKNP